MSEGEHGGKGEPEGRRRKRKMTVRWGRAFFEDIGPEDDVDGDAAAEGAAPGESDQPPPEPGSTPETRTGSIEGEWRGPERRKNVIRRERRFKITLAVMVAMVAILLLQLYVDWADPTLLSGPPPGIVGTWVTEDSVYAGTAFVISDELFELRLGEDGNYRFDIRSIRGIESANSWRFDITYTSPEEGDLQHVFFLYADGTARLKNPSHVVWTRLRAGETTP
jgi:hypothetical protein